VGPDQHRQRVVAADARGDRERRRAHLRVAARLGVRGRAGAGRVGAGQHRRGLARVPGRAFPSPGPAQQIIWKSAISLVENFKCHDVTRPRKKLTCAVTEYLDPCGITPNTRYISVNLGRSRPMRCFARYTSQFKHSIVKYSPCEAIIKCTT
jgi:hypothetical protein